MTGERQSTRMALSRILFLLPDHGLKVNDLAGRIWELAAPCELKVVLLCVPDGAEEELAAHVQLTTLAAQIRSDTVEVEMCVETGMNWPQAICRHWQPGDIVLCCTEHCIPTLSHGMQPLSQILEHTLGVPTYVLSGMLSRPARATPGRARTFLHAVLSRANLL